MNDNNDEVLFVGTAEAEHVEMYLKAIWHIKEKNAPVKISVIAKMRNSRLLEVLMDSALKVEIDEEMVCGIEHHMNRQFTDALCTMLNHPRKCPHDHEIPMGECCNKIDSN